jgi:hypothetical protein
MDTAIEKTDQNCVAAEGLLRWKQTAAKRQRDGVAAEELHKSVPW